MTESHLLKPPTSEWEERNPVETLAEEYLDRRRRGENVSIAEYAARYPKLAPGIRAMFPTVVALEHLKSHHLSSGTAVDLQLDLNQQLGDFRLIREIGRGGMGVVYEAEQQSLARPVALKIFPRQILGESAQLIRFRREAQLAAGLHHTNIVPVFGVGQENDLHFYAMQKIEGYSLDRLVVEAGGATSDIPGSVSAKQAGLRDATLVEIDCRSGRNDGENNGPDCTVQSVNAGEPQQSDHRPTAQHPPHRIRMTDRDVADIGIQVADALSYAHGCGVVHRDIKPGNLMLDPAGTVWVTDFGLATLTSDENASSGDIVGTVRFMAPEQFDGRHDPRTDIYSLGLTLYELATLQPAFEFSSRRETIEAIQRGLPERPRDIRPEIHRDLEAIILKACARDPSNRYQQASELAGELRNFLQNRPVAARRTGFSHRLWLSSRRNPIVATMSCALGILVIASLAIISLGWSRAVSEHNRAEANLSVALESINDVLQRFDSDRMSRPVFLPSGTTFEDESWIALSADLSLDSAVHQDALKFYERFALQNPTNHRLVLDTARVHHRVGRILQRKGRYAESEAAFRKALSLLKSLPGNGYPQLREIADVRFELGRSLQCASRFADAAAQFRISEELLVRNLNEPDVDGRVAAAAARSSLGQALWMLRRTHEAHVSFQTAITRLEGIVLEFPEPQYRLTLARSLHGYSRLPHRDRRLRTGRDARQRALSILNELVKEFPDVPDYRCELSEVLASGSSYNTPRAQRQSTDAVRAVAIARELVQRYPGQPRYQMALAGALHQLSATAAPQDTSLAEESRSESLTHYRALVSEFPDTPAYRILLALGLQSQAMALFRRGDVDASSVAIEEAIVQQQHYVNLRSDNPIGYSVMDRLQSDRARILGKSETSSG